MKRLGWLLLVLVSVYHPEVLADTEDSTTTLSITPAAVAGTTITASDENSRSSTVSTWANAHLHSLANTTNFGDAAAGNKSLCADAADSTDRCIRWDDTNNLWVIDQIAGGSFNVIFTSSGTGALTTNAVLTGTGDPGRLAASTMTLASTLPTTFGDFAVRANNSGVISHTSGTGTIITLDSERWDTDTMHSTSSNTGRLTATTAGRYQITGHVEWAQSPAPGLRRIQVRLNGSTILATQDCETNPLGDATVACSISTHYNLAATDYVELIGTQRAVTTLNVNSTSNYSPEFEMVKVP